MQIYQSTKPKGWDFGQAEEKKSVKEREREDIEKENKGEGRKKKAIPFEMED